MAPCCSRTRRTDMREEEQRLCGLETAPEALFFVSSARFGRCGGRHAELGSSCSRARERSPRTANERSRAVLMRKRGSSDGGTNAASLKRGFVNCRRCGSDVPVELSTFRAQDAAQVRCRECSNEWEVGISEIEVLVAGEIRKLTELLHDRGAAIAAAGGASLAASTDARDEIAPPKSSAAPGAVFVRSARLWVGNLPMGVDDQQLRKLFERYGKVSSAKVIYDRDSGRSRGFGFVEMDDESEGRAAIQDLDGTRELGRRITVRHAESR